MKCLLQMGHRNLLGHATEEYWQVLHQHFSIARPDDCTDCIPISVFGDEVEVFDGLQYACVNWSSDVALHHSDAMISKFLCVMIPTTAYYFRGKTNLTHAGSYESDCSLLEPLVPSRSIALGGLCAER